MRTPRTDVDEGPSVEVPGHAVEAGEQAVGQTLAHPVLLLTALLHKSLPHRGVTRRGREGEAAIRFVCIGGDEGRGGQTRRDMTTRETL